MKRTIIVSILFLITMVLSAQIQAEGLNESLNATRAEVNESAVDPAYLEYMRHFSYAATPLEIAIGRSDNRLNNKSDKETSARLIVSLLHGSHQDRNSVAEGYVGALDVDRNGVGFTVLGGSYVEKTTGQIYDGWKTGARVLRGYAEVDAPGDYDFERLNYLEIDVPMPFFSVNAGEKVKVVFGPEVQATWGESSSHIVDQAATDAVQNHHHHPGHNHSFEYTFQHIGHGSHHSDPHSGSHGDTQHISHYSDEHRYHDHSTVYKERGATQIGSLKAGVNFLVLIGSDENGWQVGGTIYLMEERSFEVGTDTYDYDQQGWKLFVATPYFKDSNGFEHQVMVSMYSVDSQAQTYFDRPGDKVTRNQPFEMQSTGVELNYRVRF